MTGSTSAHTPDAPQAALTPPEVEPVPYTRPRSAVLDMTALRYRSRLPTMVTTWSAGRCATRSRSER